MSEKKTYLIVGAGEFAEGRVLFRDVGEGLWNFGCTLTKGVHGTYPESFARAVARIREELGTLDLLIYISPTRCASSSPDTTARDLSSEVGRQIVGLVNACMEFSEVLSHGARVLVITTEPESYSSVHRAVSKMMQAVLTLIQETPTLEHLRLELLEYRRGRDAHGPRDNFHEIHDRVIELLQPTESTAAST